jgi:hypothetical protein
VLRGKLVDLVLEEREAERVLHGLNVRVGLDPLLLIDGSDALDGRFVVAFAPEDLARAIGVELGQRLAPFQIPDATVGVGAPRDLPAAEV